MADAKWEAYILGELGWELEENPAHPLNGVPIRVVGYRPGPSSKYQHFILRRGDDGRWAYVLLIWRRDAEPGLPYCEHFADEAAADAFLDNWLPPRPAVYPEALPRHY